MSSLQNTDFPSRLQEHPTEGRSVTYMNAFLTVIPIFLIRYGLLSAVNREALSRAAFSPPPFGRERTAFWVYQVSNVFMLLYPLRLKIRPESSWFYAGLATYGLGVALYAASVVDYARPGPNGVNLRGLYRVSRNPMYVAYFICFLGCALLTGSWILLALLMTFQVSVHWVILSEERWCLTHFGQEYVKYMDHVRRYIGVEGHGGGQALR
jgi:protein-S-isoprenylcysteine O-methyltransferase Ste14